MHITASNVLDRGQHSRLFPHPNAIRMRGQHIASLHHTLFCCILSCVCICALNYCHQSRSEGVDGCCSHCLPKMVHTVLLICWFVIRPMQSLANHYTLYVFNNLRRDFHCYSTVALVPPMSAMDVWRGIT